jgi:predicted transcriptional regulator
MKYIVATNIEIKSLKDLKKLRLLVEANLLEKPNFSEIARHLGVDRRTIKKHYSGGESRKRKKNNQLSTVTMPSLRSSSPKIHHKSFITKIICIDTFKGSTD